MTTFKCVPFDSLSLRELYDIMVLRQAVFVVEQNCPYLDADGKDLDSWHLMLFNTEGVLGLRAYTRLLPKGVAYQDYASIGRVVSADSARGTGAGKAIMKESIKQMGLLFPNQPVKIGAQSYLLKFYESLGFVSTGEDYLEDGIPHTIMILS
jgi:ElaA protein